VASITPLRAGQSPSAGTISQLGDSYRLALQAQNKSPKTILTYFGAISRLDEFLASAGMPRVISLLRHEHIESFIASVLETQAAATASNRYRAIKSFFAWCVDDGEIEHSPMDRMKPPRVPEPATPVIPREDLTRLVAQCRGSDFRDLRDMAIIRLFIDTGMRRAELAGLSVDDVDLKDRTAKVMGKGRKARTVRFTAKTAQAIDRYKRRGRDKHPNSESTSLWLGHGGPMTGNGIYQAILTRAEAAGIARIHPHQFRHTFAHEQLRKGMQEGDLMHLAGWSSEQMVRRYGKSAADERAREAYDRFNKGDDL